MRLLVNIMSLKRNSFLKEFIIILSRDSSSGFNKRFAVALLSLLQIFFFLLNSSSAQNFWAKDAESKEK